MLLERSGEVLSRVAGVKEGVQLRIQARDGELDVTVDRATSSPIVISHHGKETERSSRRS